MKKNRLGFFELPIISLVATILLLLLACTAQPASEVTSAPPIMPRPDITIKIAAKDNAFDRTKIRVATYDEIEVIFTNWDSTEHNFSVYQDETAKVEIFGGEIIKGPIAIVYRFTAPSYPGIYFFRCDVHPTTMTGEFTVEGTVPQEIN